MVMGLSVRLGNVIKGLVAMELVSGAQIGKGPNVSRADAFLRLL
jgi:hypothetical protein